MKPGRKKGIKVGAYKSVHDRKTKQIMIRLTDIDWIRLRRIHGKALCARARELLLNDLKEGKGEE